MNAVRPNSCVASVASGVGYVSGDGEPEKKVFLCREALVNFLYDKFKLNVPVGGHVLTFSLCNAVKYQRELNKTLSFLKFCDAADCEETVKKLGRMFPVTEPVIQALTDAINDKNYKIRNSAKEAFREVGAAVVPYFIERLKDHEWDVYYSAGDVLEAIGFDAVPALVEALENEDINLRERAARTLGVIGPVALNAVPALVGRLNDENGDVRAEAARALGNMGPCIPSVTSALTLVLRSEDHAHVRSLAAESLAKSDPDSLDVVLTLMEALVDEDRLVRGSAAKGLGTMGRSAEFAISALTIKLKDEDETVRQAAAIALGRIGQATLAVPELIKSLKDEDRWVRSAVAATLGSMGPSALPAAFDLATALEDESPFVRYDAAYALGEIGLTVKNPFSPYIVEKLAIAQIDEYEPARNAATRVLEKLYPDGQVDDVCK